MAGTSNNAAKPEIIDLTKLSPEQLLQIRQEFEQVSASRVCSVGVSHNGSWVRAVRCNGAAHRCTLEWHMFQLIGFSC